MSTILLVRRHSVLLADLARDDNATQLVTHLYPEVARRIASNDLTAEQLLDELVQSVLAYRNNSEVVSTDNIWERVARLIDVVVHDKTSANKAFYQELQQLLAKRRTSPKGKR